jgi:hypothetical protein
MCELIIQSQLFYNYAKIRYKTVLVYFPYFEKIKVAL